MQDSQESEVSLEERMRNLILKNATARDGNVIPSTPNSPSASAPIKNMDIQPQSKQPQKSGKKRPNQAQRRQMSSQFTIPIDPRSVEPQQGYGSPTAHSYRQIHQNRGHHTQSPSFQPAHMNDSFVRAGSHPFSPGRHHASPSYPGYASPPSPFDWRQPSGTPNGFTGNYHGSGRSNHFVRSSMGQGRSLYSPQPYTVRPEDLEAQVALLEKLSTDILANAEIDLGQITEKENFRLLIEDACRVAITQHEMANGRSDFPPLSVQLRCFGSLASGFATKSSDMDLGLLSPCSHPQPDAPGSPIPRVIEKIFLDMGLGARLLSKTRVPIIKVCERPPPKLYADLVEERTKWEKGGDEDHELEEEEAASGHNSSPAENKTPNVKSHGDHKAPTGIDNNPLNEDTTLTNKDDHHGDQDEALLDDLKQGTKTLPNYYGAAKKLLRKLGGRDITNSTAANFSTADFRILNDICLAFVNGLSDANLRTRLQAYSSLSLDPNSPTAPHRSIYGVMAQIEGEKTVIAWESRSIHEKDEHHESLSRNRIDQWRDLQNKPNCGLDPLAYNKELQLASESLKRIPSVGLLLLEQNQYETASSYHSRAIRLMIDLGGQDLLSPSPILPAIVRQYVHGIYDAEIRTSASDFLRSVPSLSLRAVARRHKSLQLAREFEKALEKGLYSAEHIEDIQRYIELLRAPMVPSTGQDMHFDYVLPITPESWTLMAKIRDLQDPSRMSPNQPRDPYRDKLEFPKSNIGVQCDINFSAQLALQNTHLLRCYSLTDSRVRPLVLFVKHWSKVRGINTPYRGTLSSYGYVLIVLHYLINVTRPPVCPNLQLMAQPVDQNLTAEQIENTVQCKGRDVRFWRDVDQISYAAQQGQLTQNNESIGLLLRGFFEYYAQSNTLSAGHMRGFDWGRDVISLRTNGGILSKQEKGWTGAKTVVEVRAADVPPVESDIRQVNPAVTAIQGQTDGQSNGVPPGLMSPSATPTLKSPQDRGKAEVKEIRHRFLFAIEDPFELDHNVARTVTHNGIVSIRDEFRRAWRIIKNAGKGQQNEDLLEDASQEKKTDQSSFLELLDEVHGKPLS